MFRRPMIELEAVNYEGVDCMENSIITIMKHELPDIHRAYFSTWNFHYLFDERRKIGSRIVFQNNIIENIQRFYGYRFYIYNHADENDLKKMIKKQLKNGHPVIVTCKSNYVPWTMLYQTSDESIHNFIIKGIKHKNYLCLDTTLVKDNQEISQEEFCAGCICTTIYEKTTVAEEETKSVSEFLLESIRDSKSGNYRNRLEELGQFIEDLSKIEIMEEFNKPGIIYATPLYRELNHFYGGRQLYLEFLKEVTKDYQDKMNYWYKKYEDIVFRWSVIRILMMSLNDKREDDQNVKDKILKNLSIIKKLERSFMDGFYGQFFQKDFTWDSFDVGQVKREFTFVDMKPYFNSGDWLLSYPGFKYDHPFPFDSIFESYGIKVRFEPRGELNSLSCKKQVISIQASEYKEIILTGYASYGQQFENLTLHFEDGTKENILFDMSDWMDGSWNKETVVWSSECLVDEEKEKRRVSMYAKKCEITNSGKRLTHITLPDNEKITLLAMTLAK